MMRSYSQTPRMKYYLSHQLPLDAICTIERKIVITNVDVHELQTLYSTFYNIKNK